MSRSRFSLFVVCALIASTFSVPVASATPTPTLPKGSKLYAIQYQNDGINNLGRLFSIDPATSTATPVGNFNGVSDETYEGGRPVGATFNAKTGIAYWISQYGSLFSVDLRTGENRFLGVVHRVGSEDSVLYPGLGTDESGQIYILYYEYRDAYYVGKLNLQTQTVTDTHIVVDGAINDEMNQTWGSFAWNPSTSTFYVPTNTNTNSNRSRLYSIDKLGNGALVATAPTARPDGPSGLAIDSSGNYWAANFTNISTGKLTDWAIGATLQTFEVTGIFTYALFIVPPSADNSAAEKAAAAAAAAAAQKQRELTEILSIVPSIAGLALNLGDLANSLLGKQKCVKGKKSKYVKFGSKCPKGYKKK